MMRLEKTEQVRLVQPQGCAVRAYRLPSISALALLAIRTGLVPAQTAKKMPVPGMRLRRNCTPAAQQTRVPWRRAVEPNGPGHSHCDAHPQLCGASSRRPRLSPPWSSVPSDRRRSYNPGSARHPISPAWPEVSPCRTGFAPNCATEPMRGPASADPGRVQAFCDRDFAYFRAQGRFACTAHDRHCDHASQRPPMAPTARPELWISIDLEGRQQ